MAFSIQPSINPILTPNQMQSALFNKLMQSKNHTEFMFYLLKIQPPTPNNYCDVILRAYKAFINLHDGTDFDVRNLEMVLYFTLTRLDYHEYDAFFSHLQEEYGAQTRIDNARSFLAQKWYFQRFHHSPVRNDELMSVVEQVNQQTPVSFLTRLLNEIMTNEIGTGNESYHVTDIMNESDIESLDPSEFRHPLAKQVRDYQTLQQLPRAFGKIQSRKKRTVKPAKRASVKRASTKRTVKPAKRTSSKRTSVKRTSSKRTFKPTKPNTFYPVHVAPVHVAPVHVAPVHVAPVHVAPVHVAPVHVAPVAEPMNEDHYFCKTPYDKDTTDVKSRVNSCKKGSPGVQGSVTGYENRQLCIETCTK